VAARFIRRLQTVNWNLATKVERAIILL